MKPLFDYCSGAGMRVSVMSDGQADSFAGPGVRTGRYTSPYSRMLQKKAGVYVCDGVRPVPERLDGCLIVNCADYTGFEKTPNRFYGDPAQARTARSLIKDSLSWVSRQLYMCGSEATRGKIARGFGWNAANAVMCAPPRLAAGKVARPAGVLGRLAVYAPSPRPGFSLRRALGDVSVLCGALEESGTTLAVAYSDGEGLPEVKSGRIVFFPGSLAAGLLASADVAVTDYGFASCDALWTGAAAVHYFFDAPELEPRLEAGYSSHVFAAVARSPGELAGMLAGPVPSGPDGARDRARDYFWGGSASPGCEALTREAMSFSFTEAPRRMLHSYDVFDTLITRKGVKPESVFYRMRERLVETGELRDPYLAANFPKVRADMMKVLNMRREKTVRPDSDPQAESTLEEVYSAICGQYGLDETIVSRLVGLEIECETQDCIPVPENIAALKASAEAGEDVILISDMYLPQETVRAMLGRCDPGLADFPLYVSGTANALKRDGSLFARICGELPYQHCGWVHTGDDPVSDGERARSLGIVTKPVKRPALNGYEERLTRLGSYGAFIAAGLFMRRRASGASPGEYTAYARTALLFVPYILWVLSDTARRGCGRLCFIARDGVLLKEIADEAMAAADDARETMLLQGSRAAWRTPSYSGAVDSEFYENFGAFSRNNVRFEDLLDSLGVSAGDYLALTGESFPAGTVLTEADILRAGALLKGNPAFEAAVLEKACRDREPAVRYLRQELDFTRELPVFVEYWGRGYTQDCLTRLLREASGGVADSSEFYYVRSIYGSDPGSVRRNFTSVTESLAFTEAYLGNLPFSSVSGYAERDGRMTGVTGSRPCDEELRALLSSGCRSLARDLAGAQCEDPCRLWRELFDFAVRDFYECRLKIHAPALARLMDNRYASGRLSEYAPKIGIKDLLRARRGGPPVITQDPEMTRARSGFVVYWLYRIRLKGLARCAGMALAAVRRRLERGENS